MVTPVGLKSCPVFHLFAGATPTAVDTVSLDNTARQGVDHVCKLGDKDGLYRTLYLGGPIHTAGTSVALNYIGLKTPKFFAAQKSSFKAMLSLQNADGSFSPYPGATPSKSLTAFVALGMHMAVKNGNTDILNDKAFAESFQAGLHRAEAFADSATPCHEPPMIDGMYKLMHDICLPDQPKLTTRCNPMSPSVANFLLHNRVGTRVASHLSMAATLLMPAAAIMAHAVDRSGSLASVESQVLGAIGLQDYSERILDRLADDILKTQDPTGGWAYITLGTAVNLMALKLRGRTLDDPAMARGVDFIFSQKKATENGHFRHSFLNAELWDTAVAGEIMLYNGLPANDPKMATMIGRLLGEQGQVGLWPFAANSPTFPDHDSSAAIVQFLATAHKTASPEQQPAIRIAVQSAARALSERQQSDGGYNAWFPTSLQFGKRHPSGMMSVAIDASTPDVTARVLGGLVAARRSGLLTPAQESATDKAMAKAVDYLKSSQSRNGSWWSRWITGYLGSVAFIPGPLRLLGFDMNSKSMQNLRGFLEKSQNADGGWGEVVEADRHPRLAGKGPSTPAQTAFGLLAGIGASPTDDIRDNQSLAAAAGYLEKTQKDGTWSNGAPLYTNIPTFDYYDAPFMTHAIVTLAITSYQHALKDGATKALDHFYGG